jgi:4-hydroxythreonine-4-phosphate dehydrogenase
MPSSKSYKIKVGITMGDPSGIGPQITAKALNSIKALADFVIIGDEWVFDKVKTKKPKAKNIRFIDLNNVARRNFRFGRIKAEYGRASVEYLDKALELIKNKKIDCLVACPISKEATTLAGFKYSGHTEYLAKETNTKDVVMMLLNNILKISLVTTHAPIKDVPKKITQNKVFNTILLTHNALKELFLIRKPRIAVCGLNPHASDNGVIGEEENKIIKPVLKKLKARLGGIEGPIPSDIAILRAKDKKYDCVIAMYHDQALIPLKLSGGFTGVNMTLGLPFIRTSPLHGTAFDIAATNSANPVSLIEAIKLAVSCAIHTHRV